MTRKQILAALTEAMNQTPTTCHDTVAHIVHELLVDEVIGHQRDDDEPIPMPVPAGVVGWTFGAPPGRIVA